MDDWKGDERKTAWLGHGMAWRYLEGRLFRGIFYLLRYISI